MPKTTPEGRLLGNGKHFIRFNFKKISIKNEGGFIFLVKIEKSEHGVGGR